MCTTEHRSTSKDFIKRTPLANQSMALGDHLSPTVLISAELHDTRKLVYPSRCLARDGYHLLYLGSFSAWIKSPKVVFISSDLTESESLPLRAIGTSGAQGKLQYSAYFLTVFPLLLARVAEVHGNVASSGLRGYKPALDLHFGASGNWFLSPVLGTFRSSNVVRYLLWLSVNVSVKCSHSALTDTTVCKNHFKMKNWNAWSRKGNVAVDSKAQSKLPCL